MNANLELFTAFLVNKRRAIRRVLPQLRWERNGSDDLRIRPFGRLDDRTRRLVNDLMIISPDLDPNTLFDGLGSWLINVFYHRVFPSSAGEGYEVWLHAPARRRMSYLTIFVMTPAPTVRPPSRMAKRRPSSIAIGAISRTVIAMLSPGITISVPAGNSMLPVTSVVRK